MKLKDKMASRKFTLLEQDLWPEYETGKVRVKKPWLQRQISRLVGQPKYEEKPKFSRVPGEVYRKHLRSSEDPMEFWDSELGRNFYSSKTKSAMWSACTDEMLKISGHKD